MGPVRHFDLSQLSKISQQMRDNNYNFLTLYEEKSLLVIVEQTQIDW